MKAAVTARVVSLVCASGCCWRFTCVHVFNPPQNEQAYDAYFTGEETESQNLNNLLRVLLRVKD